MSNYNFGLNRNKWVRNDNRQWVRIERFIIHKYVTKQGKKNNGYDLTIDCCPFYSAKLQRFVFNKEKKL